MPGTVGGAVRMNAGGHGSDMAASLVGVRVVDLRTGEDGEVPATALDLAYRRSNLTPSTVVVDATFGHRISKKEVKVFDEAVANNELVTPPAGAIGRGDQLHRVLRQPRDDETDEVASTADERARDRFSTPAWTHYLP